MTSGWIRKQEKMLKLHNVPTVVTSMCILYTREDEIFDKISDNGIKINKIVDMNVAISNKKLS